MSLHLETPTCSESGFTVETVILYDKITSDGEELVHIHLDVITTVLMVTVHYLECSSKCPSMQMSCH